MQTNMNPETGRNIWVGIGIFSMILAAISLYGMHYYTQRIEASGPFRQQILSALAEIDVIINSGDIINTHMMDGNAYFALATDTEPMIILKSSDSNVRQIGNEQVVYTATVVMRPPKNLEGILVSSLENVALAQIFIRHLPEGSEVVGGTVTLTINSSVNIVFHILPQTSTDHLVFIRDFEEVFSGFID